MLVIAEKLELYVNGEMLSTNDSTSELDEQKIWTRKRETWRKEKRRWTDISI